MIVYRYVNSVNLVSGEGSVNTPYLKGGYMDKILVTSSTSTTRFLTLMKDRNDSTIRSWNYRQGELNDDSRMIIQGINTISVSSASANELVTIKTCVS